LEYSEWSNSNAWNTVNGSVIPGFKAWNAVKESGSNTWHVGNGSEISDSKVWNAGRDQ